MLGQQVLTRRRDRRGLADIQPRDVLLARIAGGFQAPLTKAAGLFQAFTRNFAYGLKAYVDQRSVDAGEALPEPAAEVAESRAVDRDGRARSRPNRAAASAPDARRTQREMPRPSKRPRRGIPAAASDGIEEEQLTWRP